MFSFNQGLSILDKSTFIAKERKEKYLTCQTILDWVYESRQVSIFPVLLRASESPQHQLLHCWHLFITKLSLTHSFTRSAQVEWLYCDEMFCLVIVFCSEATHKFWLFIRQLRKLKVSSECLGHYNLVIHSLHHSNLFNLLISVLLPLSLSWAWAVLASVFWQWLDTSCPLGCLPISLLAPDLISRLRLRPGQCWVNGGPGRRMLGVTHHSTSHSPPHNMFMSQTGMGRNSACNKFIREDCTCFVSRTSTSKVHISCPANSSVM